MKNHRHYPDSDLEDVLAGISPDEAVELRKIWSASASGEDAIAFSDESVDAMRRRVLGEISPRTTRPPIARRGNRDLHSRRFVPALVIVIVSCLLGTLYLFRPIVVEAPLGEFATVLLPDNSTVVLNSGARLTYPRYWGEKRSAHLDGEAYFDISKDKKPFILSTFDAEIEVLGTRFNVKAWQASAEPHTTVALASGSIRLSARTTDGTQTEVIPGEIWQVQYADLERLNEADSVIVQRFSSWQNGNLYFHNLPLSVIIDDIERRYSTRLELNIPEIRSRRISYSQQEPVDIEHVLDNLCAALGVQYRAMAFGFEIYND